MTNIKTFIKKLRNAAEVLEELFVFKENENSNTIKRLMTDRKITITKKKKLHWTQRPENKTRVKKWMKKMSKGRYGK